jgi:hypothetical protein
MPIYVFCAMFFAMTLPSLAQTVSEKYEACLQKRSDELMCALEAAPPDIQAEIKKEAEAAEERIRASGTVEDAFAGVAGTYGVVARRLEDLAKQNTQKSKRLRFQASLSAESAELAEIVAKAVAMANTYKARLEAGELTSQAIPEETTQHAEAVMKLTNEATVRFRGNKVARQMQSLADTCMGDVSVCQHEAIENINSQIFIWGMGLDDVRNDMYETAIDDLIALLQEYEKK